MLEQIIGRKEIGGAAGREMGGALKYCTVLIVPALAAASVASAACCSCRGSKMAWQGVSWLCPVCFPKVSRCFLEVMQGLSGWDLFTSVGLQGYGVFI